MAILFDFLPIVAFILAYKFAGIFVATGVLIVGVVLQAALQWFRERKVSAMLLISAVVVLILGSITLIFRNETFIQWKPSVASWVIAAAFVAMHFFSKKTAIEQMFEPAFGVGVIEQAVWRKLNFYWVGLFVFEGFVNWWLLASFDLTTWVNWHLPILSGITVIFMVAQTVWLSSKMPPESPVKEKQGD
jgi:intracellular septation protein